MISLSRLRRDLDVSPSNEDSLGDLRAAAIGLWESATDRLWTRRTDHVEELRPLSSTQVEVRLELSPIEAIATVEQRDKGESSWTVLEATEYVQRGEDRIARVSGYWAPEVRVTYTGGYVNDAAPADVLYALVLQARFMGARHGSDKIATRGTSVQGGGATFMEDAFEHPHFKKLAKRYRRRGC